MESEDPGPVPGLIAPEYHVPSADPENAYLDPRASLPWDLKRDRIEIPPPSSFVFQLRSILFMAGATALGRLVLAFHNVEVKNLDAYRRTALDKERTRPLITVSNHQATLDDPLLYSILTKEAGLLWPTRQRSTVGAAELCFANWFVGTMCKLGKVLPVVRGDGIWQQWVDKVVGRLSAPSPDNWVHIFPEGRVHQAKDGALLRFKWGLGRMVADPEVTPIVLPIFIEGTKLLLDEKRPNPWLLSSFRGSNISIRIGEPIDFSDLVTKAKEEAKRDGKCDRIRTYKSITEQIQKKLEELRDNPDL